MDRKDLEIALTDCHAFLEAEPDADVEDWFQTELGEAFLAGLTPLDSGADTKGVGAAQVDSVKLLDQIFHTSWFWNPIHETAIKEGKAAWELIKSALQSETQESPAPTVCHRCGNTGWIVSEYGGRTRMKCPDGCPAPHAKGGASSFADQLKALGYAPGGYYIRCIRCGETGHGCDKRATSCRRCAIAALQPLDAPHAQEGAAPAAPGSAPDGVGAAWLAGWEAYAEAFDHTPDEPATADHARAWRLKRFLEGRADPSTPPEAKAKTREGEGLLFQAIGCTLDEYYLRRMRTRGKEQAALDLEFIGRIQRMHAPFLLALVAPAVPEDVLHLTEGIVAQMAESVRKWKEFKRREGVRPGSSYAVEALEEAEAIYRKVVAPKPPGALPGEDEGGAT